MNFTNSTKISYVNGGNTVPILLLLVVSCLCCLCFIIRCCYDYYNRIFYDNYFDCCYDCYCYKSNKVMSDEQI